jgi:hypothetical protein
MGEMADTAHGSAPFDPSEEVVADLLRRAADHPRGVAFLREGALDAVAATFHVHAFVVEAARTRVREASVIAV